MKNLKYSLYLTLLASSYIHASDAIYCPQGKVLAIQSQTSNVLINISIGGWKNLGGYADPALPTRLSLALAAQASNKDLMLAFPLNSNIDCYKTDYGVVPYKVKIIK